MKLYGEIQTGSGGLNQYMMNRLALGGYMEKEKILKAESLLHENNRAGFLYNYGFGVGFDSTGKSTKRPYLYKVNLDFFGIAGSGFSIGFFRAAFIGNADYKGSTLALKSSLTQFTSRQLQVTWNWNKKNYNLKFGLGFGQLMSWRKLQLKDGYVKTDSSASNVHVLMNGDYFNATGTGFGGKGYGFTTHLQWSNTKNNRSFSITRIGINNLGIFAASDVDHYKLKMDSAAHFQQITIDYNTLNTSAWLNQQRDTVKEGLNYDSSRGRKMVVSPFRFYLDLKYKKLKFSLQYINSPAYIPSLTIGAANPLTWKQWEFGPALQLGGFDTYNINLSIGNKFALGNRLNAEWMVQVNGIEGLLFPNRTHGTGVYFGLKVTR